MSLSANISTIFFLPQTPFFFFPYFFYSSIFFPYFLPTPSSPTPLLILLVQSLRYARHISLKGQEPLKIDPFHEITCAAMEALSSPLHTNRPHGLQKTGYSKFRSYFPTRAKVSDKISQEMKKGNYLFFFI